MRSFILLLAALALADHAHAQQAPAQIPPEVMQMMKQSGDALMQATVQFHECMTSKLGPDAMNRMQQAGTAINERIVTHCKSGDLAGARAEAVAFSTTTEGQAALACGKAMQAMVASLNLPNQGYSEMMQQFAEGKVPDDMCAGMVAK